MGEIGCSLHGKGAPILLKQYIAENQVLNASVSTCHAETIFFHSSRKRIIKKRIIHFFIHNQGKEK
jgi:hypothetical protein